MSYFINGKLLPNENLMNITVDDEIVGNLWISLSKREGQTRAFLTWIDISPDFRRKGYAKEALELMEQRLRSIGAHYFELSVFAHNTGAQKLYLDLGFTITKERRFGHSQKPSRITMTKYLIANALFNS